MYLVNQVLFQKKLFFLFNKIKKSNIFDITTYDSMITSLCSLNKIKTVKNFITDLFNYYQTIIDKDFEKNTNFKVNFKVVKILFLSLYIHNEDFDSIIFNNKTEYNNKLKKLSLSINESMRNCFEKELSKDKFKLGLTKIVLNLYEFFKLYKKWERIDKRINTNNHLLNYYKIELKCMQLKYDSTATGIVRMQYEREKLLLEKNVRYMNDAIELKYFMDNKKKILMHDTIKDELYWLKIKYEISCDNMYINTIVKLIEKTKNMFIDCVPNRLDIHSEIHDNLDLKIIEQTLIKDDDGSLDEMFLYNKITYILNLLEGFQAPEDDDNFKLWKDGLMNQLHNQVYFKDFIPYFFENLYGRLLKILDVSHKLKQI